MTPGDNDGRLADACYYYYSHDRVLMDSSEDSVTEIYDSLRFLLFFDILLMNCPASRNSGPTPRRETAPGNAHQDR